MLILRPTGSRHALATLLPRSMYDLADPHAPVGVHPLYSRANSVDQFIEHLSGHPQEVEEGLLVFPSKFCHQSVVVAIQQSPFSL